MWEKGVNVKQDLQGLLESLVAHREELNEWAEQVVSDFWDEHYALNAHVQDPRELARLGARCRVRQGSLEITWFRMRWQKQTGGKSRVYSTYLRKGRGNKYSANMLSKGTTAAEWEIVSRYEEKFATLRRQHKTIQQAVTALREAVKTAEAVDQQQQEVL